jgi:hypothetical protein
MKQRLEQGVVATDQRSLQLSKPTLGDCQIGFCSGKHGLGFFAAVRLHHITFASRKSSR